MTKPSNIRNPELSAKANPGIRWRLILTVVAVWAAYIAIAFNLGRGMTDTWSLVAVFGALTASFCAVRHSKVVEKNRINQNPDKKREEMLYFFTIGFSLATIQAGLFTFYFAW